MAEIETETKPAPPTLEEIAASNDGLDLGGWIAELGTPDPVLESLGGDLAHYRRLLRDHQVKSAWQQRQRAVVAAEWKVEPGGDSALDRRAAADLEAQLRALDFDRVSMRMLHAQFYGYAVGECLYGLDGKRVVLSAVKVRKPERFRLARDGRLLLLRAGRKAEEMPASKFWVVTADGDNDDDPHGLGAAHQLYWPVFLKRNGAKFWAVALEKFGLPTATGNYPPGASEAEIHDLLDALRMVHGSSAVAFPDGFKAELLESTKRAGGDHETFLRYWDEAIAKILLSQTMTTDNGSSRAQASVHADVRDDVVKGDADLLCESFNQGPARWLSAWNFPGAAPPRVWRELAAPEDLDKRSQWEERVARTSGLRPTAKHVRDTYGGEWQPAPSPAPASAPPASPAAFAEGDATAGEAGGDEAGGGEAGGDAPGDAIEALTADELDGWEEIMDPIRARIQQALDESGSAEAFIARLPELAADLPVERLHDSLARSLFAARAAGELGDDSD